jgi:hypothetical protein
MNSTIPFRVPRWSNLPYYSIDSLTHLLLTVEEVQLLQGVLGGYALELKLRSAAGELAHTVTDKTYLIHYFQKAWLPLTGSFEFEKGSVDIIFIPTPGGVKKSGVKIDTKLEELIRLIERKTVKTEEVARDLQDNPGLLNSQDAIGATLLFEAAWRGNVEITKLLLDKGADPNLATFEDASTPLIMAAEEGHVEIMRLLLSKGAKINTQATGGITALHTAAYHGQFETVKLLLDKGAKTNIKSSEEGETASQVAIKAGHKEIASLIERRKWKFW